MLSRSSWRFLLSLLLLTVLTVWSALTFVGDDRLHVYFFDVGQGDSILIKSGNFEMLIDGGPDQRVVNWLGRTLPPWDRTIEVVVLTHPHADHVTGLVDVLERYEVGEVWGTGAVHTSQVYLNFLNLIKEKHLSFRVVQPGEEYHLPVGTVTVLYPLKSFVGVRITNLNESSIVAKLTQGNFSLLLTGDIEEKGQQELVDLRLDMQTAILKVPHHGSDGADLTNFITSIQPKLAIISAGAKNRYGHPHPETLAHYQALDIPILRTDSDGTILLATDGTHVWIKTTKTGTMTEVNLGESQ
jgi:competence protein ComEC